MDPINPYRMPPGPEMDRLIQEALFGASAELPFPPAYSRDSAAADQIKRQLKAQYGTPVHTGRTKIDGKTWYARFGNDPSTSTEVVAETYPLAVCRLALLLIGSGEARPRSRWKFARASTP